MGIWKIEEDEDFFLSRVTVSRAVTHPHKRLQHLAGRYLLTVLFDDFPLSEILIADTRKPFLENEDYHFSISHCGQYAAAIASRVNRAGVDIEIINPTVEKIAEKFLNQAERDILHEWENFPKLNLQLLTILWSAKESIYKWYGLGQVDFKQHIHLKGHKITVDPHERVHLSFTFQKGEAVELEVESKIFGDLVLTWLIT